MKPHQPMMITIWFKLKIMIMMLMTCLRIMMKLKLKITSLKNVLKNFNNLTKIKKIMMKIMMLILMMMKLNSIKLKEQILWLKYLIINMMKQISKKFNKITMNFIQAKKQKTQSFCKFLMKLILMMLQLIKQMI